MINKCLRNVVFHRESFYLRINRPNLIDNNNMRYLEDYYIVDLLRAESINEGEFIAPIGDYRNDVDCGCSALPCFAQKLKLEKFATPGIFVGVLSLVGFFHGCVIKYFRGTSLIWSKHYSISPKNLDWLTYLDQPLTGIFALAIAYWGNRVHRATWLGTLTIYLSVTCLTLSVPEIIWPLSQNETDISSVTEGTLCTVQRLSRIAAERIPDFDKLVSLGMLVVYQITYALCTITFICHGLTYVDDNVSPKHSPGLIGLILAAQRIGKQVGIYCSWAPLTLTSQAVFVSPLWLVISSLTFLAGSAIALFPLVLPNTLLRKSVVSLLSLAAGNEVYARGNNNDGFFKSVWRLTKNKVLFFNIHAIVFIQSAIITFTIFEKSFNQSMYHVSSNNDASGYSDPTLIQFTTNLLKQPMIAISFLTTGMVIAKVRPSSKNLVLWNIGVYLLIGIFFASIRFLKCTNPLKNESHGRLTVPYCSWDCGCLLDGPFKPICLNGETHFSPCLAGCSSFDTQLKIYQNCTCGGNDRQMAIDESCDADNCRVLWSIAQVNSILSSALVASTILTSMIISLRCVSSRDKAMSLAMYLTNLGIFPYLTVRPIYTWVSGHFCAIYGKTRCQFYSASFATFLASSTLVLIALAIIFTAVLLIFIDKVELYKNNNSNAASEVDLSVLRRNAVLNINKNNNPSSSEENSSLIQGPRDILRNKQKSESKLDILANRSSKEDRVNTYISEGDLVPPLRSNLKPGRSTSNRTSNSNQSALTDSSLSVIANHLGDDHDSDFSTLQRPQRVKMLEKQLQDITDSDTSYRKSPRNQRVEAIIEHNNDNSSDSSESNGKSKDKKNELIETSL